MSWQEQLHGTAIELGLDRVREVADRLDLLDPPARVVTVAGTNGKGSCVATLEALLLERGARVGAFTSPHFHRYNERIRVDGKEVDDVVICDAFQRIDSARGEVSLTYFEFGTLAALDIFNRLGVEFILLEVGLGGRLDAVNIVDADIGIVTSIGLDHEDWLGTDLDQIGREKAGIFRTGRWALTGDASMPDSVARRAQQIQARWLGMGDALRTSVSPDGRCWNWEGVDADGIPRRLCNLPVTALPLPSVAVAIEAFLLLGYSAHGGIADVLSNLSLPGRSQVVVCKGIEFILDVAHNPAAARFQAEKLSRQPISGKTVCLSAIMVDKDRHGIFQALADAVDDWHVCGLPNMPRAASAGQLLEELRGLGIEACSHSCVADGMEYLLGELTMGDRVLVMGSFFTVAAAQSFIGECRQGSACG